MSSNYRLRVFRRAVRVRQNARGLCAISDGIGFEFLFYDNQRE